MKFTINFTQIIKMKIQLLTLLITISSINWAQTTLIDEDFTNGIPSSWTVLDEDGNTPAISDFINGWIQYITTLDTCAASTSYYLDSEGDEDTTATSADYLILPQLNLLTFGNLLSWDSKSFDASYPDGYYVLVSTTDSLPASFTDTIKVVDEATPYWKSYTINLMTEGYANQSVYVAFRNFTQNGFVLGLDNVKVTTDDPANIQSNESVEVNLYPNPVQNELQIDANQINQVNIFSLSGQLILSSTESKINVSSLVSGMYVVEVLTSQGVFRQSIIKN